MITILLKLLLVTVILLYRNNLKTMTLISVYKYNHYLQFVIDSTRSNSVVLYKIAYSRWIILQSIAYILNFVSQLVRVLRKLLN
jgi:hypothetical protein